MAAAADSMWVNDPIVPPLLELFSAFNGER
jgi:hypothetical protein